MKGLVVRERRKSEGGAAAVEFALIFPLFAALVMGMVQYGFYFWTAETTGSAARETARRIVVGACWSGYDTFAQDHGPRITSTAVSPDPAGLDVGQSVTVTVVADGDILNFFPLPDTVTREYTARMEVDEASGAACE
jgi:Flp pilus assembly pilin Flp